MQNDEPVRMYMPLPICPWIMQACRLTSSCHLGTTCALCMLDPFYWCIYMTT